MSEQVLEVAMQVPETNIVAETVAVVVAKTASLRKFAEPVDPDANPWGITNDRGQLVTRSYLSRYIQCWCRKPDGFVLNRKENFAFFMTDAFMNQHRGKHASEVGHEASKSTLWGNTGQKGRPSGAHKAFVSLQEGAAIVAQQGVTPPVMESAVDPVAEAPRVDIVLETGETIKIVDLPAGKQGRKLSKKQLADRDAADLLASKPAMIEALEMSVA